MNNSPENLYERSHLSLLGLACEKHAGSGRPLSLTHAGDHCEIRDGWAERPEAKPCSAGGAKQ